MDWPVVNLLIDLRNVAGQSSMLSLGRVLDCLVSPAHWGCLLLIDFCPTIPSFCMEGQRMEAGHCHSLEQKKKMEMRYVPTRSGPIFSPR